MFILRYNVYSPSSVWLPCPQLGPNDSITTAMLSCWSVQICRVSKANLTALCEDNETRTKPTRKFKKLTGISDTVELTNTDKRLYNNKLNEIFRWLIALFTP